MPDILRTEFDRYLPDTQKRSDITAEEPENRREAARLLSGLLAEDDNDDDNDENEDADE
jgi:hypothetical protein